MKSTNPIHRAHRKYLITLIVAMAAYIALLFTSIALLNGGLTGSPRLLVALLPVPPIIVVFIAVLQLLQGVDEFERRILIESLALAAGITAILSVTYGFLENAGFPTLSAWWTWSTVMGTWLLSSLILRSRYR